MTAYRLDISDDVRTWHNLRILIVGYGKEGKAAHEYIERFGQECTCDVALHTDSADFIRNQYKYDVLIKSPGIPPAVMNVPYKTATNLFFAHAGASHVIGVTGTKGKSTTASLLTHVMRANNLPVHLVGNIGTPGLKILSDLHQSGVGLDDQWFVFELSSYQLCDIRYSPHIALVTSLFPEHMDYHGDVQQYYAAKKNLIRFQNESDYFIYPDESQMLREWSGNTRSKVVPFISDIPRITLLKGEHNRRNIAGVVTAARVLQIDEEVMVSGISTFQPLTHRLQFVATVKGIDFYDDAISTTPQSTIAALRSLTPVDTLMLGGLDRGYDFSLLIDEIKKYPIRNIVLFPQSGGAMRQLLEKTGVKYRFLETTSMKEAVAFAFSYTKKGSICLLSTASPSYSLWKNFEEKGDQFQSFIRNYSSDAQA